MRRRGLEVSRIITSAKDAAVDQTAWPTMVRNLTVATDAIGALFTGFSFHEFKRGFIVSSGLREECDQLYLARYQDTPITHAIARQPLGRALDLMGLVGHRTLKRTELHRELLFSQGIGSLVFATLPLPNRYDGGGIGVALPKSDSQSCKRAVDILNYVAPSLVHACDLSMQLGQSSHAMLLASSMDHLPTAILLVDHEARVVIVNKQAKSLLLACDELTIRNETLGARARTDGVRLRELIRAVAISGVRDAACVIHEADGSPSLIVSGLPIPDARAHFGIMHEAHAMLIISTVEDRARASANKCTRLMKLFGLTRMESRVALAIAKGSSVPEVAHELSIGAGTAHTHLQQVFQKTGVNRQSALTRLLSRCGLLDMD